MRAGRLDRRVSLYAITFDKSELRAPIESRSLIATVWGRWIPASASERFTAEQRVDTEKGEFEIRHRTDVDAVDEIDFDGDSYRIIGQPVEIGRREGLRIPVERRVE